MRRAPLPLRQTTTTLARVIIITIDVIADVTSSGSSGSSKGVSQA